MRRLAPALVALLLTSCVGLGTYGGRDFHIVEPDTPKLHPIRPNLKPTTTIETLTPEFSWRLASGEEIPDEMEFDLGIWIPKYLDIPTGTQLKSRIMVAYEDPIYLAENLAEPHHIITEPLRDGVHYMWAVRTRMDEVVSEWSWYEMWVLKNQTRVVLKNRRFPFTTDVPTNPGPN